MRIFARCAVPIALLAVFAPNAVRRGVPTETVSVCSLEADPDTYNHKLIDVSGFLSHGFEEFTLADPKCHQSIVWLEYGDTVNSDTLFCCGTTVAETTR